MYISHSLRHTRAFVFSCVLYCIGLELDGHGGSDWDIFEIYLFLGIPSGRQFDVLIGRLDTFFRGDDSRVGIYYSMESMSDDR